jgi:hypothetical protein
MIGKKDCPDCQGHGIRECAPDKCLLPGASRDCYGSCKDKTLCNCVEVK